jgi:RNA polymerase sigma-70 factor (subfamily 1)
MLAWLRQILARTVTHATRELHSKKRDIKREQSMLADLDASSTRLESFLAGKEATPSQNIMRKDQIRIVAAAIELLPEEQRQIVMLRYWEEKSLREISALLGKSTSSVAGLLHRAAKKLRSLLNADGT